MQLWHIVFLIIGGALYWYGSKRLKKVEEERMKFHENDQETEPDADSKNGPVTK